MFKDEIRWPVSDSCPHQNMHETSQKWSEVTI